MRILDFFEALWRWIRHPIETWRWYRWDRKQEKLYQKMNDEDDAGPMP